MWFFRSPRIIAFGEDALDYLEEVDGSRAFVVTDKTIARLGILDRVVKILERGGKAIAHYDGVLPEPPETVVYECLELIKKFKPDLIIGLGGGSAMDVAKASMVLYEYPDMPLNDITPLTEIKIQKTTLIGIPTTSGTGSEVTWAAVITDSKEHRKMELLSYEIVPYIAIVDPALTKTLPPTVTATSGMDALAQAIDSFTVQWRNDFTDGLAIHSTRMLLKYLPKAFENPDDLEAREKVHNAATISGLSWSNAQLGITHSFGHAMGGVFHFPHGVTVGMVLPYSIEFALKTHADLYGRLARAIGVATSSDDDGKATMKLRDAVKKLMKEMEMPLSLKEAGISKKKFEESFSDLVRQTKESGANIVNCREPTNDEIEQIWRYMFEGQSIDF